MKRSAPQLILVTVWACLLILAGIPSNTQPTAAAPVAVVTGTEQPTRTPTNTPVNTPATTPVPTNTATPRRQSAPGKADPAIEKSVSSGQACVSVGDELTFTLSVTNRGTDTANDVVVTDPFPEYLDVIEAVTTRGNVTSNGRTVIITIGPVKTSDTVTIRIRVRVNALAQPPEGLNSASLTTSSGSDDPSNNSSAVKFPIGCDITPTAPAATPAATPATAPGTTPIGPTPERPRQLPRTGAEQSNTISMLIALGGLLAIGVSLLLRRGARK